jgi:hypothetical protein
LNLALKNLKFTKDTHNPPANTAKTAPLGIEKIIPAKGKDVSMEILKDKISEPPANAQKIEELQGKEIITSRPKQKKYAQEQIESHLKNITDKSALAAGTIASPSTLTKEEEAMQSLLPCLKPLTNDPIEQSLRSLIKRYSYIFRKGI